MRNRHLLAGLGLGLALSLSGCITGGNSGGGGTLTEGHYFIQNDQDDVYQYHQYFVVEPGGKWEFIEYGISADSTVCQITRQAGSYRVADTTLLLTLEKQGASLEKCPVTQSDFNNYQFSTQGLPVSGSFPIRNVTAQAFDSQGLFINVNGWYTYRRGGDPYGYYSGNATGQAP